MASPTKTSDWQSKRAFEETNLHMLQNDVLFDVIFLVGIGKKEEIKAHTFMLVSRSPVFYSMFCGSLKESSDTIQIPDVEPWAFRELLRFIYTENCRINEESVMALLYCSKKYETKRLTEKCMKYLNDQISEENVCVILQHAHSFDEKELEEKCLTYVLKHGNEVLKTDGFLSVSKEILRKMVESNNLNADELSIYNACKRWALQQCKQNCEKQEYSPAELREQLCDLVYSIRFPTMSFDTFTKHVTTDGILTQDEMIFIYQSKAGVIEEKLRKNFTRKPRTGTPTQRISLRRCVPDTSTVTWSYCGGQDAINFTVSKSVRILGVSLFSPTQPGSLEGQISLLNGTLTIASKCDIKIAHGRSKYEEEVLFDLPVTVDAEKVYTIIALLKGPNTHRGKDGQVKASSGNLVVSFFKNHSSTNGTGTIQGQIPSLIFEI